MEWLALLSVFSSINKHTWDNNVSRFSWVWLWINMLNIAVVSSTQKFAVYWMNRWIDGYMEGYMSKLIHYNVWQCFRCLKMHLKNNLVFFSLLNNKLWLTKKFWFLFYPMTKQVTSNESLWCQFYMIVLKIKWTNNVNELFSTLPNTC